MTLWQHKNKERAGRSSRRSKTRNWFRYLDAQRQKRKKKPRDFNRSADGRFGAPAASPCTLGQARLMYETYLAAVCAHQGLLLGEVERQLKRDIAEVRRGQIGRRGRTLAVNRDWKAAVYARQLALYLANTSDNVPQVLLAQVTGLTPAAVCLALRAIEDLRDHSDYDALVELVAAQMAAPGEGARP